MLLQVGIYFVFYKIHKSEHNYSYPEHNYSYRNDSTGFREAARTV